MSIIEDEEALHISHWSHFCMSGHSMMCRNVIDREHTHTMMWLEIDDACGSHEMIFIFSWCEFYSLLEQ